MATAAVEERQLLKTLRWYDGFVIALANPGFLLGSLGYSVGDLGGWGAAMLWGISAFVAVFINTIYSELAAMFPEKSGGLSLYAHEAWRKYTTLVGPIATFGYWIGWSVVLSVNGLFIGQIIQGAWFPSEPFGGASNNADVTGYFSTGTVKVGLPQLIGIGLILAVWLFNVRGVRVGMTFGYLAGALLMVPLFVMMILPFLNGSFDSANLDNTIKATDPAWGGLQLALVWLWLMCWSAWGVDVCATFAPEYKDTARDTKTRAPVGRALLAVRLHPAPDRLRGGWDAGARRCLRLRRRDGPDRRLDDVHGLLRRLSRRELHHHDEHGDRRRRPRALRDLEGRDDGEAARHPEPLPRPGERDDRRHGHQHPASSSSSGTSSAILAASNLGYVLAHMFALSGFVLLRRDRPNWPRPIKLSAIWTPIAGILAVVVPDPDDRRLRLDAGRRRRLRRHEGEDHRRGRPRDRASCSSSSGASSRTASGRTGARRRRRCRTRARRLSSQEEMRPA